MKRIILFLMILCSFSIFAQKVTVDKNPDKYIRGIWVNKDDIVIAIDKFKGGWAVGYLGDGSLEDLKREKAGDPYVLGFGGMKGINHHLAHNPWTWYRLEPLRNGAFKLIDETIEYLAYDTKLKKIVFIDKNGNIDDYWTFERLDK